MEPKGRGSRTRVSSVLSNRKAVGLAAEAAAHDYLQTKGYAVIQRNWRCRTGEIDLIARDGGTLVFAEVRSRTSPGRYGSAVEAVTPRKCRQVRETAQVYLRWHAEAGVSVRFDVVAVTFSKEGTVEELKHLTGAF